MDIQRAKELIGEDVFVITPKRIIVEGTIDNVYEASRMIRIWIYGDIYTVFGGEIFETKRLADEWLKDNNVWKRLLNMK